MKSHGFGRLARAAAAILVVLLVGATFRAGVQKGLVGTIGLQEWGRYLFGIGAALTQSRWGIGGYVIDSPIEQKLQVEGLTDNPDKLKALGLSFPDNFRDESVMQRALEQARAFDVAPAPHDDFRRLRGSGGDDIGIAPFTTLAFWLFGSKISALYYTYFVLLCATIFLCVLGHWRSPAAMACLALMVLSLYLLVTSDLVNFTRELAPHRGEAGSDVKDPRFFGTIAAFPALHLLLTWLRRDHQLAPFDVIVLFGQAVVLAFVIQIRWPVLWLLFALYAYWIVRLASFPKLSLRELCHWRQAQSLPVAAVYALVISGGVVLVNITAHPIYRLDGDLLHHPLWQNAIESLEANPDWDLRYLSTVNGIRSDEMPREIARQEIAKLPPDQRSQYLTRGGWPSPAAASYFARARFFQILWTDPLFVLHTFLVDQPKMILSMLSQFYLDLVRSVSLLQGFGVFATVGMIVWIGAADPQAPVLLRPLVGVAGGFSLIALLPSFIAALPHQLTMIDHFLWFLLFLCLLICFGGVCLARGLAILSPWHRPF